MRILNWNARGLNAPKKRKILKDLIIDNSIDLIAIQETKKESFTLRTLQSISRRFDKWIWVESHGRSGGILVGCDSDVCQIVSSKTHTYSVNIFLHTRKDSCNWMLTVVYAPVVRHLKSEFWNELRQSRIGRTDKWVVCGDFNAIRARTEKSGSNFNIRLSGKFNDFVDDHHLLELKLHHKKFTWVSGRNKALLDRFLVSLDWLDQYPHASVHHLSSYGSDHTPLVLDTGTQQNPSKQFKFDPEWLNNEEFVKLVIKWWQELPLSNYRMGLSWHNKLKNLRRKILGWTKNYYGEKKRKKQAILDQIQILEQLRDDRDLDANEQQQWLDLKSQLDDIYLEEEKYWHLRSRQQWLHYGDQNTKYFHRIAYRHKKNKILTLEIDENLTNSQEDIHTHIQGYYKHLLGTPGCSFAQLGPEMWGPQEQVSLDENALLVQPFSEAELHKAIFESDSNGAPGPDGLTF